MITIISRALETPAAHPAADTRCDTSAESPAPVYACTSRNMTPHKIEEFDYQLSTMIPNIMSFFNQSNPNSSPVTDDADAEGACPTTSASCDNGWRHDQRMPPIAPVSLCASEETTASHPAPAPALCVTGSFSNIERKYHIDPRVLGTGHHGSVRECIDRATGANYAVKSVRKDDPAVKLGSLAREILLLREVNHKSIIRLVDVYEDAEYVHLVTDLCEGGELFDKIVEKSSDTDNGAACFAEDEAARIMHQILTAISYMHKRDIVHRDIKPENILIESSDEDSPVKIIDFGLSRKHRPGHDRPMTTIVGTPYYIAPEVLRRGYDKLCDVWSAGVIAYILLCGYPPFNGEDGDRTHCSVLRGRYCFPAEDWKDVSPEAMDFVRRTLRMDPRKRMTAEQALNHPWIVKHCAAAERTAEEELRDHSSVEVLYHKSLGKGVPAQSCDGSMTTRTPTQSPPRKVRLSMFGR